MVLRGLERATDIPQLDAKGRGNNAWALVGVSAPGGGGGLGNQEADIACICRQIQGIDRVI